MTTQDKLSEIFCEVFDDTELTIAPDKTANDVEGWDSLSHVNLIVAIEGRFNISFSQKELWGDAAVYRDEDFGIMSI